MSQLLPPEIQACAAPTGSFRQANLNSRGFRLSVPPPHPDLASQARDLPFLPQYTNWPVWIPSAAMNSSVRFLKRYGSRKTTLARGAPRPGSWMMSCRLCRHEQGRGGGSPIRAAPPPASARTSHLHDALDVAVSLGEVHRAQTGGAFSVLHVRAEHGAGALPLPTDHAAHGGGLEVAHGQRPGGPGTPATPAPGPSLPGLLPPCLGTPSSGPNPGRWSSPRVPGRRMAADGPEPHQNVLPGAERSRKRKTGP